MKMTQPELGRKIPELRKARGFTQEQLVDKCNLNVRTLQRIESGEVIPRSHTIRVIFEALEYDLHVSLPGPSEKFLRQLKDQLHPVSVSVTDSIALEKGKWTIRLLSGQSISGEYLTEWRLTGNKWLIVNDISTSY